MLQKVIQVGNSFAVTIPRRLADSLEIAKRGFVDVKQDERRKGRVVLDFMREKEVVDEVVDPKVYEVAKRLLKRYLPAFKELAKR